MTTAKDEVRELLDKMPEEVTLEDIQYQIYVRQKVQKGLVAANQARVITQAEMEKWMSRWSANILGLVGA